MRTICSHLFFCINCIVYYDNANMIEYIDNITTLWGLKHD